MLAASTIFHTKELVRNQYKRILTVNRYDPRGMVYVEEEPTPYSTTELEKIDQTNVIKFIPRY
jgi:hypothetical protein